MTARINLGSIRPSVEYGDAEIRQGRIDRDRALGIRDTEGDVNARAEARLWGSRRSLTNPRPRYAKDERPARQMLCAGRMFPATMRNADRDDSPWNGGGHRGIVWASNDGEWIDEPIDDAYMPEGYGRRRVARHKPRVYVSDRDSGWYSWRCSCGAQGAPDILHREYARDAWREAHGLEPVVNRPLV